MANHEIALTTDELFNMTNIEIEYVATILNNFKQLHFVESQSGKRTEEEYDEKLEEEEEDFSDASAPDQSPKQSPRMHSKAPPRTACDKHRR